ncbi:hypothetical protein [Paracoccus versutus]|nr:hypothetical protein [Paracoccus versutus]
MAQQDAFLGHQPHQHDASDHQSQDDADQQQWHRHHDGDRLQAARELRA